MSEVQNKKLLIFTFSPVQGFISTARKPRDLFTGSYIISYLTKELITRSGLKNNVVFPRIKDEEESLANYANKFVAIVDKCVCEELKETFKEIWKEIYESVWEGLNLKLSDKGKVYEQFLKHVENYFSVFCECRDLVNKKEWKRILEISGKDVERIDGDEYAFTYDLTERVLGAKKSWRPYKGIIDDAVYKDENGKDKYPDGCTMCGERLHLAIDWKKKDEIFGDYTYQIRKNEKLCGVCLVKRFAVKFSFKNKAIKEKWNFPSTEEIAGIKFKQKLKGIIKQDKELEGILRSLYTKIVKTPYIVKSLGLEGVLQIDSELFRKEAWEGLYKEAEYLKEYKREIEEAYEYLKERNIEHKNPYYAILISDGDSIGDWLGIRSTIRKDRLSEEFHKEFSKKLSEYAKEVSSINEFPVQIVYAGGDDLMAFMHPADVVNFAHKSAELFSNKFKEYALKQPSISAGIIITHAKMSLQKSLEEARKLEKKSKENVEGKGAVSVGVLTRNGSLTFFSSKWEDLNTFYTFKNSFKDGKLGTNFAYEFRNFEEVILKDEKVFASLLKRELKRKVQNKDWENLFSEAMKFLENTKNYLKEVNPVKNFIDMLYVAKFIAQREGEL